MDYSQFRRSNNVADLRNDSYLDWGLRQLAGPFIEGYEGLKHPLTGPETIPSSAYNNPLAAQAGFYDIDKLPKEQTPPPQPLDERTALMIKALQQGF